MSIYMVKSDLFYENTSCMGLLTPVQCQKQVVQSLSGVSGRYECVEVDMCGGTAPRPHEKLAVRQKTLKDEHRRPLRTMFQSNQGGVRLWT